MKLQVANDYKLNFRLKGEKTNNYWCIIRRMIGSCVAVTDSGMTKWFRGHNLTNCTHVEETLEMKPDEVVWVV